MRTFLVFNDSLSELMVMYFSPLTLIPSLMTLGGLLVSEKESMMTLSSSAGICSCVSGVVDSESSLHQVGLLLGRN